MFRMRYISPLPGQIFLLIASEPGLRARPRKALRGLEDSLLACFRKICVYKCNTTIGPERIRWVRYPT